MGSMVSGNQASAKHVFGRFMQTFPNAIGVNLVNTAYALQPNIALQLTPTASLLVPFASLRRR